MRSSGRRRIKPSLQSDSPPGRPGGRGPLFLCSSAGPTLACARPVVSFLGSFTSGHTRSIVLRRTSSPDLGFSCCFFTPNYLPCLTRTCSLLRDRDPVLPQRLLVRVVAYGRTRMYYHAARPGIRADRPRTLSSLDPRSGGYLQHSVPPSTFHAGHMS